VPNVRGKKGPHAAAGLLGAEASRMRARCAGFLLLLLLSAWAGSRAGGQAPAPPRPRVTFEAPVGLADPSTTVPAPEWQPAAEVQPPAPAPTPKSPARIYFGANVPSPLAAPKRAVVAGSGLGPAMQLGR